MFGNKKNDSAKDKEIGSFFDAQKDPKFISAQVRTMKKDLENIGKPGYDESTPEITLEKIKPETIKTPAQGKVEGGRITSPFLDAPVSSQAVPPRPIETPQPSQITTELPPPVIKETPKPEPVNRIEILKPEPPKEAAKPQKIEPIDHFKPISIEADAPSANNPENVAPKKSPWGKLIIIAISVFVIIIIGLGGYYFWVTKQSTQVVTPAVPPVTTTDTSGVSDGGKTSDEKTPPPVPTLSTENPNYMSLDIEALDEQKFKEQIFSYETRVAALNSKSSVEFVITDLQNNPIDFSKFAQKIGITLSKSTMENLGNNFSLFIYNSASGSRLGLSIDLASASASNKLKTTLLGEESNLADEIKSLFPSSNYTITNKKYAASTYSGVNIRYLNIVSPEELSVDYAISGSKLLIGTTKPSMLSAIDYIQAHSAKVSP